ncbi:hypothetical protein GCM10009712_42930 [Pseudarthrobacter sulfonivorans]|uniref:hypothetical protein n=1 Tax=Pseudarthrobacter sulfonivorans TaxID=121292 RepID=UPI00168A79B8|nr:hypothetical protein [Pseudarthrobacter sulfonivorans]
MLQPSSSPSTPAKPPHPGQTKPHAGSIAALTGVLAEQGINIRDGLFVGNETPYDDEPGTNLTLPVSSTQTSAINADFIYRGSFVEPTNRITLRAASTKQQKRPPSNEAIGQYALLAQYTCIVAYLLAGRIEYPVPVRFNPQ